MLSSGLILYVNQCVVSPQVRAADGRGFQILEESLALTLKTLGSELFSFFLLPCSILSILLLIPSATACYFSFAELANLAFIATHSDVFNEEEVASSSPRIQIKYNDLSAQIAALEATDDELSLEDDVLIESIEKARQEIR